MKAAVVLKKGSTPKYIEDFPTPQVQHPNEMLLSVTASAVKNLDKLRASGTHYSSPKTDQPFVVGGDGVGYLESGARVYAIGISGMLAEKAIIDKNLMVELPDNIDHVTAAALPNAVMGAAMALRFRAKLLEGETVLINGATGVTGKIAVQLAKYYGAKKVIATGRNPETLQSLLKLGADKIISLTQQEDNFMAEIKQIHQASPIDIIIDYLWGNSAELLLSCLKGNGDFTHNTRYVTIGGMMGDNIQLSSSILRSTNIQLSGSGIGSWTKKEMKLLLDEILPEMFLLAAKKELVIETEQVPLTDIENAWAKPIPGGKRLVILI